MYSLISTVFPIEMDETNLLSEKSMSRSLLFIGHQFSCKTSLLFQMIQTLCEIKLEDIHYIVCQKEDKLPNRVQDMLPIDAKSGHFLSFLKVFYLSTYESLINHFKALEKSTDLCPGAIIINNAEDYIKEWSGIERQGGSEAKRKRFKRYAKDDKQLMAELSAFLTSVGNSCEKRLRKHSMKRKTLIVMGYDMKNASVKEFTTIESIGQRFFDEVWSLRKTDSEGSPIYQMDCKTDDSELKLTMSLEDNEIVLNSMAKKN